MSDYTALQDAINASNANPDLDTITFTGDITLTDHLPLIITTITFEDRGNYNTPACAGGGGGLLPGANGGNGNCSSSGSNAGGSACGSINYDGITEYGGSGGFGGGLFTRSGTLTLKKFSLTATAPFAVQAKPTAWAKAARCLSWIGPPIPTATTTGCWRRCQSSVAHPAG